ncbi:MAG: alpha/beta fold hydrolase [Flavobacteriales bacterium]|nr:alpha/beta fold hydrolase [Flavobacteriales bacterium]
MAALVFSEHDGVRLAVRRYGRGHRHLIALHGFGRDGSDMAPLAPALGSFYTLHAFDLHFHGASDHPQGRAERPFTPEEFAAHFVAYVDQNGLSQADLLGYSLGGRLVMALVREQPQRFGRAFLVAPDGLTGRPWYRALAGYTAGRYLYRVFIRHAGGFHRMVDVLHAMGAISAKRHRFLIGQTDTTEKRELLHDVWLSYRKLGPGTEVFARTLLQHGKQVDLIIGARDRIIPPTVGDGLVSLAPGCVRKHVRDEGHALLTPELGEFLARLLEPIKKGA